MHLFQKSPKYAFAYASMQMHNYPKPIYYYFITEKLTPLAFETQPKLLSVNLTNNLISDIQKGTFVNMTRLVRLILTRNKLKRIEENVLAGKNSKILVL